jgi:ADP-ribosyl-[dinitrogen reductase] hydrolase
VYSSIEVGNDTDTVAAITGAHYGSSAVPFAWRRRLYGWSGLRAHELASLAVLTLNGGQPNPRAGRPASGSPRTKGAAIAVVSHPDDAVC